MSNNTTVRHNLDSNWLLTEDTALKAALSGVQVSDGNSPARPLKVWFSQPDPEIRLQSYPYATIDLIDIVENTSQVHSQWGDLNDPNKGYLLTKVGAQAATSTTGFDIIQGDALVPVLLVYQISTWARHPRHDRSILAQLNGGVLHPRFGQLDCPDGTSRRLVVRSFAKRDTTVEQKRLYRNIWTVAMPSELVSERIVFALTQRVQQVIINHNANVAPAPPSSIFQPTYYPGT